MSEVTQALEELYRRRYTQFRNGVATLTHSYDAARDVVQEAFARALRAEATFRGEGSLEAWVWRMVVNAALRQQACL